MHSSSSRIGFVAWVTLLLAALAGGRAGAEEPPAEAVRAELPFLDSDQANRILVDLAPEASVKPMRLMLDTGASDAVITPQLARSLGVSVRRQKHDPYRRATRLGKDLQFWIDTRRSDTRSSAGMEYGVFGGAFLSEYVVEIDFPGRRDRLLDAAKFTVPASVAAPEEAVVPIRLVSQRPGVEVAVNGETALLTLDTGCQSPAVLSGQLARRAGVASTPAPELRSLTAVGPMEIELATVRSLRIGPFEFTDTLVEVAPKGWYNIGFPENSVIGYDLLAPFVLRLDYANQRLWLRRVSTAAPAFFGADAAVFREIGALLQARRGVHVASLVRAESVAARRGLRAGDRIAGMESAAAIARTLREGRELTVMRDVDGIAVDTVLESVASESAVSAPPEGR